MLHISRSYQGFALLFIVALAVGLLFAPVHRAQAQLPLEAINFFNAGDIYTYAVFLYAGELVTIEAVCLTTGATGPDPDINGVWDPDGDFVTADNDSGNVACGLYNSAFLTFTPSKEGVYEFDVENPCSPGSCNAGDIRVQVVIGFHNTFFSDGRINQDAAQAASVYCRSGGAIEVLFSGGSIFASKAEIDAVGIPTTANTLIEQSGPWRLYRLVGGAFQVNGPSIDPTKEYYVIWDGCPPSQVTPGDFLIPNQ